MLGYSHKSSARQTICMKCQAFSEKLKKKKKKISKCGLLQLCVNFMTQTYMRPALEDPLITGILPVGVLTCSFVPLK